MMKNKNHIAIKKNGKKILTIKIKSFLLIKTYLKLNQDQRILNI